MANENKENNGSDKPAGPALSVGLRIFILVNIILLGGVAAWWAQGFVAQSSAQAKQDALEDARKMSDLITANPAPRESAEPFAGPVTYVLDASARDKWVHFSFGRTAGKVADAIDAESDDWDIAFRRAKILTNGGATGKKGKAEVAPMTGARFEDAATPPADGFYKDMPTDNIQENMNPALDKWYDYDFLTHKLRAKGAVLYVMKTARGDMVKFQILNYYCGGASGCYTIKYEFIKPDAAGPK